MKRLGALAVLTLGVVTHATGPGPEYVPISRLVQNLSKAVEENPKSAEQHYLLGRIHYFAFMAPQEANKDKSYQPGDTLGIYGRPPAVGFDGGPDPGTSKHALPSRYQRTPEQQVAHVREAVRHLKQALLLRGDKPRTRDHESYAAALGFYELCLACALEGGAPYASKVGELYGLPPTPEAWRDAAIRYYLLTYQRAISAGKKLKYRATGGRLLVEEAADSYRRLLQERGELSQEEIARLARMEKTLAPLQKLPAMVTPLLFSLTPQSDLSALLASNRRVRFDLAGVGRPQTLPWLQPETAILCWDPAKTGKITSGKQLFGSVTWWMFWRDGYEALGALDDNHDGWISGRELSGLALWFDRNQNGVSDPGEVVPIAQTPVAALAVTSTTRQQGSLMNPQGLRLKDGTTLPTWDWIVTPER